MGSMLFQFDKKKVFQIICSMGITVLLFYVLVHYVPWESLIENFKKISLFLIIFSFCFFLLNYTFRSLRIFFLLSGKVPFSQLWIITLVHVMFVQLLPFRTGELSFLYFIEKTKRISSTEALLGLASARVFDVFIIFLFFFVSFFLLQQDNLIKFNSLFYILSFLFFTMFFVLFFYGKKVIFLIQKGCQSLLLLTKSTFLFRFLEKLQETLTYLESFQSKKIFLVSLLSIGVWCSYYVMTYVVFTSFGAKLPLGTFVFIVSAATLFMLVPIQGFAGFGNVEFSWTFLLVLFGVEKILALQASLLSHSLSLFCIIILGILGIFLWFIQKRSILRKII